MNRKPIRHHYIPQFILRSFRYDDEHLYFYDKKTKGVLVKRPGEVFMERNLYRDTINHPDESTQTEKDLGKYENEMAPVLKRFIYSADIILTHEEDEKLKLFFAIMGFRSGRMLDYFGDNLSQENKEFYSLFQEDGDLVDFWRRNLAALANCRYIRDVMNNPEIDKPVQIFMLRDSFAVYGTSFMLLERRGPDPFVLSDCYPVVVTGMTDGGLELPMYSVFPISPNHTVIQFSNGIEACAPTVIGFEKAFFKPAIKQSNGKTIRIRKQLVYEQDVRRLNKMSIRHAEKGVILQDKTYINRILE